MVPASLYLGFCASIIWVGQVAVLFFLELYIVFHSSMLVYPSHIPIHTAGYISNISCP